jgi:DNA-binding transcriptional ArsR family regulator
MEPIRLAACGSLSLVGQRMGQQAPREAALFRLLRLLRQVARPRVEELARSQRLVRYRKQGRNVYYSLDDAHIRLLLDVGIQHVSHAEATRG